MKTNRESCPPCNRECKQGRDCRETRVVFLDEEGKSPMPTIEPGQWMPVPLQDYPSYSGTELFVLGMVAGLTAAGVAAAVFWPQASAVVVGLRGLV